MIRVVVQDEHGVAIGKPVDLPSDLFPEEADSRFVCLKSVDLYGDTVFNRIQARSLRADLQLLNEGLAGERDRMLVEETIALVDLCLAEPHRYIKFIGD